MSDVYKENYEMRKKIEAMTEDFSEILSHIYCIGGPLNDNAFGYNKKQLTPFSKIALICKQWEV